MSNKLWKGPCAALIAAYNDPVAGRIASKAGEQGFNYNIAHDGRSAEVQRFGKSESGYFYSPLGHVEGGDPLNCIFQIALDYLEHDRELLSLLGELVSRRADALDTALHEGLRQIEKTAATLSDALVTLRRRHVRA